MSTFDLVLDPQLKIWVLLPISFVMVLLGLLRSNITFLIQPGQKLEEHRALREKHFLRRAACFKTNFSVLNEDEFTERQQYYIQTLNSDKFYANPKSSENEDPMNQLMSGSTNDALMNMVKGNLMNYIPQTLTMAWVNFFFAGFVIMKLPFPLTDGFKSMLQNGVANPDLNVRYVSAISWYFVNLFGLRPIYSLLTGDSTVADQMINQQQQNGLPQLGGPGAPKIDKIFKAEAENIHIISHSSVYDGIADRIINKYK